MKISRWLILVLLFNCIMEAYSQTLPVGTSVLEDYYRRGQILGKIDSTISFTIRPVNLANGTSYKDVYIPDFPNTSDSLKESQTESRKSKKVFKLLPVTFQIQSNTDHPVGFNDGAMIPARGYQQMISAGFYAKIGRLSIQLRPEYVYASNKEFQQFYSEQGDQEWYEYSELYNFIDLPERFGEKPYNRLFWGQSNISLTFNPISIGVSNENLWWGPGIRNSLLMSNNAPGFKHITLNTVRPVRTKIGSFESQIIMGRLENSGILPPDTNRKYIGYKLYIPKREEWRCLTAAILTYQPKWTPGLFLGYNQGITMYGKDLGPLLGDIFSSLNPFGDGYKHGWEISNVPTEHRSSLFFRWLMQKSQSEFYAEYGREYRAYSTRDLMLQFEYTRAFIIGFRKLYQIKRKPGQQIQIEIELTQLEQTNTNPEKLARYWYSSREVRQGYTNVGQVLGAGIGPGSNLESFSVSWVKSLKLIGFQVERFVHNNDLHNIAIKDIRGNWVDLCLSAICEWDHKNFLVSSKFGMVKSFNYEDYYRPTYKNDQLFWIPGFDVYNFHGSLNLSYRF
jgi:hypothetical protein